MERPHHEGTKDTKNRNNRVRNGKEEKKTWMPDQASLAGSPRGTRLSAKLSLDGEAGRPREAAG